MATSPSNTGSTQGTEQQNTIIDVPDLGQSQYDFRYLVFPNDLGKDDNGHYMIININVPTQTFSDRVAGNLEVVNGQRNFTPLNPITRSKVDTLRFGGSTRYENVSGLSGAVTSAIDTAGRAINAIVPGVTINTNNQSSTFSLRRKTRRIAESIALHMPTPLVYNSHNVYEEISLSALGMKLGSGAVAAAYAAGSAWLSGRQGAINRAASLFRTATGAGQVIGGISKFLQSPINPAVEILFANTLVRQFTLEVLMAPRNEQESLNMHAIIKTLRFHGAPEIVTGGLFFSPPAEFDITFFNKGIENMNILRINTCVLERIEVDYAPTGVYSTFRNGHPVAARLSMGFRELEPVHKLRTLQGF